MLISRFALVGAVGFLIEAVVLGTLVRHWHFNPYAARLVSFSTATLATWLLNRRLTFRDRVARNHTATGEYVSYLLVQVLGALLNLGVFSTVLALVPALRPYPEVALAIGAAFGLVSNFLLLNRWLYRKSRAKE